MNFVPVKTVELQAVLSLHRVHEMLIGQRTATINQLRGLLTEFGVPAPKERRTLLSMVPEMLEDLIKISPTFLLLVFVNNGSISGRWNNTSAKSIIR